MTNWYYQKCTGAYSTKTKFFRSIIVSKNGYFFLRVPFSTTKCDKDCKDSAQSCSRGWIRIVLKKIVCGMRTFRCGMTFMTNMIQIWQQIWQIWTTNMTENTKKSPKITKITTNHHQHPPTNQYVPQIWFLVTICINYKVCQREKC